MRQYRKKRGFTLIETLVVVAILVILMGVAIPAVAVTQSNLKMKELDDTARQIFLVVQNRLTTMKSTGELYAFDKKMDEDMSAQKLRDALDCPPDYGVEDSDWMELYYLSSDQELVQDYLVSDSDVLAGALQLGTFMVELNPSSGDVYSVFYSEEGAFTRDQIRALPDRLKESRRKVTPKLGYYGGNAGLSASAEFPERFAPQLKLVNAEDLYLQLNCGGLRRLIGSQNKLKIAITITDERYSEATPTIGIWNKELQGATDFNINAMGELSIVLMMDSLRPGEDFKTLMDDKLRPGDNIQIRVDMTYVNGETVITGEESVAGNSLFEKKGPSLDEPTAVEIQVGHLRHLNNLRESIYKSSEADIARTFKIITQVRQIDFNPENWDKEAIAPKKKKPEIPYFEPIQNKTIFTGERTQTLYNGKGYELRNFVFGKKEGYGNGVGLFAEVGFCSFRGVRLVDSSVDGNYSNVGLLTPKMEIGFIVDCRVYLSTRDEDDRFVITDEFIDAHSIKAGTGENVGGFVGKAMEVQVIESFVSIPVHGGNRVGGLIGHMNTGYIANSYSSGDITATGRAGGLVGYMGGGEVSSSYSTANVTAKNYGGGIAGEVSGSPSVSAFKNTISYGEVKVSEGAWDMATSGPLIGTYTPALSGDNLKKRIIDCKYFSQGSYNKYTGTSAQYGTATGFIDLCVETPNPLNLSIPYSRALEGSSFPFPHVSSLYTSEPIPHYGNWPSELRLQTSLVYYEKYADNTYGYYAVTSLTTKEDDAGGETEEPSEDPDKEENLNQWKVDTLEDKTCIEDGYALMTIYPLDMFKYKMEGGEEKTVLIEEENESEKVGKSTMIGSKITLEFTKESLTYRITNANVYRLPLELQLVDRTGVVPSFYTKLVVNGFIKNDAESSDEVEQVINNFTFFYCPDFAKNAVNPDPEAGVTDYPENPVGEANPVFVRSARQFNGLGRSYYYWNTKNSANQSFYFLQETDINFGTYTKSYCGEVYDLMNTALQNKYRNKPIGRPGNQDGASFQNTYDGGSHEIVDYCLQTYPDPFASNNVLKEYGYQYTGMFGEIKRAVLKNMVLVASNPGGEDEPSSGYVKSNYEPGSNPGTGVLVGLVYAENDVVGTNDLRARIINCAISGYDVSYNTFKVPDVDGAGSRGYGVVGGMVGFNYGVMENCTAAMKSVSFTQSGGSASYLTRNIGGLVGSMNDNSTVTNCYTSGTLVGGDGNGKLVYGGIAGGWQAQSSERSMGRRITDSYSTCVWDLDTQVNAESISAICPSRNNIVMENCYYLILSISLYTFFSRMFELCSIL